MFESHLAMVLEKSKKMRELFIENESASYYNDVFHDLKNIILKKLNSKLLKNRNAKIIVEHLDEILPYIVMSNIDILLLYSDILIEQPNFKEKFIDGLKKYPYKEEIGQLFYNIWISLNDSPSKFDEFVDEDILRVISEMDLSKMFYTDMLNRLNEDKQRKFLDLLIEYKRDIPYSAIEYKGENKQIIYDNLSLFIENAQNLYSLMNFVKDNPDALSKVKKYIDNNEEKAINSIFCETDHLVKIKNPVLKELIKLIILDVMKNENVKFSDISYNGGGFSRILLIGNKVIKLGDRITKSFPNNPYIVAPLLRKEFNIDNEKCFAEVTERVDTSTKPSSEELYQLFKNLRDIGLVWTDIKGANVGRLKRENTISWQENLEPTDEVLGLGPKRESKVLGRGDLVILDADFIYDENDPNINYANNKALYDEFEKRYQNEKRESRSKEVIINNNVINYELDESKGIHR